MILGKFTKPSKIGISMEYFTVNFSQFSGTNVKIYFLGGRLVTRQQIQAFQRFSWNLVIS